MGELGSNQKGDIAEVAIRLAAIRAGIGAYEPTGGHSRADMLFEDRYAVQLRLTPPRNNQRACINLADAYEFAGAVAQLGERRHGMAEARGSSPLSSTSLSDAGPTVLTVGSNPLRNHLGYWMDVVAEGQEVVVTRHGRPRLRLLSAGSSTTSSGTTS